MLNFWIEFAINIFVGVLRAVVKNPAQYAGILKVLMDVDADLQEAIAALQNVPTPAPPSAPPAPPSPSSSSKKS